jgi:hypothetical protein
MINCHGTVTLTGISTEDMSKFHILGFYKTKDTPGSDASRGMGKYLMCWVLNKLQAEDTVQVTLLAGGDFNLIIRNEIVKNVNEMDNDTIIDNLKMHPIAMKKLLHDSETTGDDIPYENVLVTQLTNSKLADYYTNSFGFKRADKELLDYYFVPMVASAGDIRAKCKLLEPKKRMKSAKRNAENEDRNEPKRKKVETSAP